jgi:putative sigma-54 modulation protein
MVVTMTARHFQLTDPIKDHIQKLITEIEKYNLKVTSTKVIMDKDKRDFYDVELIISIAEKGNVVVHYTDKDLYTAIDKAKDKLEKVLRRYHDKITTYRGESPDPMVGTPSIAQDMEGKGEIIVPMPLDIEKPVSVEEALDQYLQRGLTFMVFRDRSGEKRVLYRRRDGKFGLY